MDDYNVSDMADMATGIRRSNLIRFQCANKHTVCCDVDIALTLCPACLALAGAVVNVDQVEKLAGQFTGDMVLVNAERRKHAKAKVIGRIRPRTEYGTEPSGRRDNGRYTAFCTGCGNVRGYCVCEASGR